MDRFYNEMMEITAFMHDENVYGKIKDFSQVGFLTFLGMLTDQYGADNGLSSKETTYLIDVLAQTQKEVHNTLGNTTSMK